MRTTRSSSGAERSANSANPAMISTTSSRTSTVDLLLERALDEGDVHPPVELVRRVADGAHRLEAQLLVQLEAGAVVGRHRGDDGPIPKPSGLLDQLLEQGPADAPALVDRVDVDEVLDHVEAALL